MRNLILSILLLCLSLSRFASAEETFPFDPFGQVHIYQSSPSPSRVVLFVSGDGGWNLGVVDMARALAEDNALVVGIDITHYLKILNQSSESCTYPAGDFENLSKFIQKKKEFTTYIRPILVGYSSGATLVYAAMVQAPPNTFLGAISLGFCPSLPITQPFCKGYGLKWTASPKGKEVSFLPAKNLQHPWIAFQGTIDQVCNADETKAYVKQVPHGELVLLPKVGHGFSVQRNWMPQFRESFSRIGKSGELEIPSVEGKLSDLPLVELPAKGDKDVLAVVVSGDGGWASLDRDIGNYLVGQGIAVVGLDSLRYFWSARTPDEISKDLNRILSHYLAAWEKNTAVLIGYSMGADVLPFMVSRLPQTTLDHVSGLVLLGPSQTAKFEFHMTDWLGIESREKGYPVLPELEKIAGMSILCLSGSDEEASLCRQVNPTKIDVEILAGGHHFSGDYTRIGEMVVKRMRLE